MQNARRHTRSRRVGWRRGDRVRGPKAAAQWEARLAIQAASSEREGLANRREGRMRTMEESRSTYMKNNINRMHTRFENELRKILVVTSY